MCLVSLGEYRNNLYPISDYILSKIISAGILDTCIFPDSEREWIMVKKLDGIVEDPAKTKNDAESFAVYELINEDT